MKSISMSVRTYVIASFRDSDTVRQAVRDMNESKSSS